MRRFCVMIPALCLVTAGCVSRSDRHLDIARDMVHRVADNRVISVDSVNDPARKIWRESDFEEVDLNYDHKPEVIVHFNWYDPNGFNLARGAQSNGSCYAYRIEDAGPAFLGELDGRSFSVLWSNSNGFRDIETESHYSWNQSIICRYAYDGQQYGQISKTLVQWEEDGWIVLEQLDAE